MRVCVNTIKDAIKEETMQMGNKQQNITQAQKHK